MSPETTRGVSPDGLTNAWRIQELERRVNEIGPDAAPTNGGRRITSRELGDKLEVLRAEQHTEHIKTRSWVIVSAALTGGSTVGLKLAAVLGYVGWQPF